MVRALSGNTDTADLYISASIERNSVLPELNSYRVCDNHPSIV